VLNVVRSGSAEENRLLRRQPEAFRESFKSPSEVADHLLQAPWQRANPLQRGLAELLEGRSVIAWKRDERIRAQFRRAEIDEMIRLFVPADVPPQIGIDRARHDLLSVLDEERLDVSRQDLDRPPHDEAMRRPAPGGRWRRQQQRG